MTRVSGSWLSDPVTQRVMRALEEDGHQVFAVGGCVRNALLGVPISDVDLSTSARPDQVMALGDRLGISAHPTGIEHGTVTLADQGTALEITTFRRDVETDGRRAVVAFADTVAEDALRRDFTMNALYTRCDGAVVDPLGGLADLQNRHIRFIEDPRQRIREDYLRILRFFRFYAHYGDPSRGIDAEGLAACAAHVEGLGALSKERIGAEVMKLLGAPDPAPAIAVMEKAGVLAQILPSATGEYLAPLVHLEECRPADAVRRLAAMNAQDVQALLRLSKEQARRHQAIRDGLSSTAETAELAYRLGAKSAEDVILLRAALMSQPLPGHLAADLEKGAAARFPIRGTDLENLSGRALGERLKELEAKWIGSGFKLSKSELLK